MFSLSWIVLSSGILLSRITGILIPVITVIAVLIYLGWMHRRSIRQKGFPITKQTLSPFQERTLELNLPYDSAFALCRRVLDQLPDTQLKAADYDTGRIRAKTKISWDSLGEKIPVRVLHTDPTMTQVILTSQPLLSTTIWDYGRNLMNVEFIGHSLQQLGT